MCPQLDFLLETLILIAKVTDITIDRVVHLDREVCFLSHSVQLERGVHGCLQEGLPLHLMLVEEDHEDIFLREQVGSQEA